MLTMRGVDYGSTFCAVGARGFAGEGYPYHRLWWFLGMSWKGTTLAGKTMTELYRNGQLENGVPQGNMILKDDGMTPKEYFPKCIWGSLRHGGELVNQVGLSNFGLKFYLRQGVFNKMKKPFMTSIMLMESTREKRRMELFRMLHLLRDRMPSWATYALQINFACPNTDHDVSEFYEEMVSLVALAKSILSGVPIVANVNALVPTDVLVGVARVADALWIGNTIPFGDPRSTVNWKRFGVNGAAPISPLALRNQKWVGGLSGPDCFWDTEQKVKDVRRHDKTIPIVAGNGIRTKDHVRRLKDAGADACFYGSGNTVRPWYSRSVIKYSNQVFA